MTLLATKVTAPSKSSQAAFLKVLRIAHRFLGVFTAPALLFFAFTGALQTFSLHEIAKDRNYTPPAWIASIGQLHKKQNLQVDPKKLVPQAEQQGTKGNKSASKHDAASETSVTRKSRTSTTAVKIFFLVVCVSLALSTVTGLQMAWKFSRSKPLIAGVAAAGLLLPLLLLAI